MSAPVFLASPGSIGAEGASMLLDGPEGRHAATVKRIRVGEVIELVDGAGTRARCTTTDVGKDSVRLLVDSVRTEPAPQPRITVIQALAKGERAERAVELMTEAGVDEIVPWAASRSVVRWDADKAVKGGQRWAACAREAAKQSRRSRVPLVTDCLSTSAAAARAGQADLVLVLHESATQPIMSVPLPESGEIVLVVGPEGGVSDEELNTFPGQVVRLGPEVVRTSTAAALAAAVLSSRSARWSTGSQVEPS